MHLPCSPQQLPMRPTGSCIELLGMARAPTPERLTKKKPTRRHQLDEWPRSDQPHFPCVHPFGALITTALPEHAGATSGCHKGSVIRAILSLPFGRQGQPRHFRSGSVTTPRTGTRNQLQEALARRVDVVTYTSWHAPFQVLDTVRSCCSTVW